jgi:hypothetical protein
VVSDFTITVVGARLAEARFTLSEVGGVSGATIREVNVFTAHESDRVGEYCWRNPIRVNAGATLNTFNEGWSTLTYCAPTYEASATAEEGVSVTVTFTDDSGVVGTTTASTAVIR